MLEEELHGEDWKEKIKAVVNSIKLPFVVPSIKTYPLFTGMVSILESFGNAEEWVYNNYILLWMYRKKHFTSHWADFKYGDGYDKKSFCPLINIEIFENSNIYEAYGSNLDFLAKTIAARKYICTALDVYYIREWWGDNAEPKHHERHPMYINGYNPVTKEVYVSDFMAGVYKTIKISYDTFKMAFGEYNRERLEADGVA